MLRLEASREATNQEQDDSSHCGSEQEVGEVVAEQERTVQRDTEPDERPSERATQEAEVLEEAISQHRREPSRPAEGLPPGRIEERLIRTFEQATGFINSKEKIGDLELAVIEFLVNAVSRPIER